MSKPLPTMPGFLWLPTLFAVGVGLALVGWSAMNSYGASRGAPRFTMAVREGGTGTDRTYAVTADDEGNLYAAGVFSGTATVAGQSVTSAGSLDGSVAKYSVSGQPVWVKTLGGSDANVNGDSPFTIALGPDGSVFVGGLFTGTCTFADGVQYTSLGGTDIFISKYSADGVHQWTRVGGSAANSDVGRSIVVDASGNSYLLGEFGGEAAGAVFDGQTIVPTGNISHDWGLAKYDPDGTLIGLTNLGGGSDFDSPGQMAIDGSDLYMVGFMTGSNAVFGGIPVTGSGGQDIVVLKADLSGTVAWVKTYGGTSNDLAVGLAVSGGALYTTGSFGNSFTYGSTALVNGGGTDAFLARHSTVDGSDVWVKTVAGSGADAARGIVADAYGVYQFGSFSGTTSVAGTSVTSAGGTDLFLASYDAGTGNGQWTLTGGGAGGDTPRTCVLSGGIVCSGYFTDAATFGGFSLASAGGVDGLFLRVVEVPGSVKTSTRSVPSLAFTVRKQGETGLLYTLSSPTKAALSRVSVVDAGCAVSPVLQEGDAGADGVLGAGETWIFSCGRVDAILMGVVTPVAYVEGNGYYLSVPATWAR